MNRLLAFSLFLGLVSSAFASSKLHSVECVSKDLTLSAVVTTSSNSVSGIGFFKFQALTAAGLKILAGPLLTLENPTISEAWATGNYFVGTSEAQLNDLVTDQNDLAAEIKTRKPLLYFYTSSSGALDGQVSYIGNDRVDWLRCTQDEKDVQLTCPKFGSVEETDLILNKGPLVKKNAPVDPCLEVMINERLAAFGRTMRTATNTEIKSTMSDIMAAAWKAEVMEREMEDGVRP